MEAVEDIEEEEEDIEIKETMAKRKIVGCLNKEEAATFQEYVQNKMIVLVEKMQNDKNIIQLVRELIRALKLEHSNIDLFENNGATDVEEIVQTILESKGTAWWKYLEGKEIQDAEDYNMIVEAMAWS